MGRLGTGDDCDFPMPQDGPHAVTCGTLHGIGIGIGIGIGHGGRAYAVSRRGASYLPVPGPVGAVATPRCPHMP